MYVEVKGDKQIDLDRALAQFVKQVKKAELMEDLKKKERKKTYALIRFSLPRPLRYLFDGAEPGPPGDFLSYALRWLGLVYLLADRACAR